MIGEGQEVLLRQAWREGLLIKQIAPLLGVSEVTVWRHARRLELPVRPKMTRRSRNTSIALTDEEWLALDGRIRSLGLSKGEYLRRLMLWDLRSVGLLKK